MRKSSPSFCQDTPDRESRRHWEVIMIVLTDGKDASSAYCLTTALYCPLPGQYRAIARHKTIRRERKSPLSFLLFTLHQIAWNPDKHWGSERWRVAHHSSPLFTLPKQLIHKYLRHSGEGWRVLLKLADNRYKLQRITNPQRKGRTFFNGGLQIRRDA